MSCNLNKLTTYDVGRVVKDESTGSVTAQLIEPPSTCQDKVFSSKRTKIVVAKGSNPTLTYSVSQNVAIVTVPNKNYVEYVNGGLGMWWAAIAIGVMVGAYILYKRAIEEKPVVAKVLPKEGIPPTRTFSTRSSVVNQPPPVQNSAAPVSPVAPVVVNNSSSDGLLTGVIIGSMLSGNNHGGGYSHDSTTVVNNTTIVNDNKLSNNNKSSDDNDRNSSYSSDNNSSSYSSDDNSSSYSSDSSSSYSSDSGGGSFSSD